MRVINTVSFQSRWRKEEEERRSGGGWGDPKCLNALSCIRLTLFTKQLLLLTEY